MHDLIEAIRNTLRQFHYLTHLELKSLITDYLGDDGLDHNIWYLVNIGELAKISFGDNHVIFVDGHRRIDILKHNASLGA